MTWPTWIRIINIVALLAGIPSIWPYGYYTLLRIITSVVCGILAYTAMKTNNKPSSVILWVTVFIYNPIVPLHLGKEIWIIVNLATVALLAISFKYLRSEEVAQTLK
jgi:hypothetical protein